MPSPGLAVKHKKYTIKFKEEVVKYAKEHSVVATAQKFRIHRKNVQEWKRMENRLHSVETRHDKTYRLPGSGRKVQNETVEKAVMDFVRNCRVKKLHVSRSMIKLKAIEIFQNMVSEDDTKPDSFTASEGWLTKFLERHNLTLGKINNHVPKNTGCLGLGESVDVTS